MNKNEKINEKVLRALNEMPYEFVHALGNTAEYHLNELKKFSKKGYRVLVARESYRYHRKFPFTLLLYRQMSNPNDASILAVRFMKRKGAFLARVWKELEVRYGVPCVSKIYDADIFLDEREYPEIGELLNRARKDGMPYPYEHKIYGNGMEKMQKLLEVIKGKS